MVKYRQESLIEKENSMNRNDKIKHMLSGISNDATLKQALKVVAYSLRKHEDEDEDEEDTSSIDALNTVAERIADMTSANDGQSMLLDAYERHLDKNLTPLLDEINNKITDRISALRAITGFDLEYFSNIPFSVVAKQNLAASLINLTQRYAQSENTFWRSLVNGNADVMNSVSFTNANTYIKE